LIEIQVDNSFGCYVPKIYLFLTSLLKIAFKPYGVGYIIYGALFTILLKEIGIFDLSAVIVSQSFKENVLPHKN